MAVKNYNGIEYNDAMDYAAELNKAKASGADQSVIDRLTKQREAKIAGEGLNNDGTKKSSTTSSTNKSSGSGSKNSLRDYYETNRETAYTWLDNGKTVTTYSNSENFEKALEDAIKEGQLTNGAQLKQATSYYTGKKSDEPRSKDGGYSRLNPSKNSETGRDAYVEALSRLAGMSSDNTWNHDGFLDSYYPAMDDLYNYVNTLTPEEQAKLAYGDDGRMSSEVKMALKELEKGYTPVGNNYTPRENVKVNSWEEFEEYMKNFSPSGEPTYGTNNPTAAEGYSQGNVNSIISDSSNKTMPAIVDVNKQDITNGIFKSDNPYNDIIEKMQGLYADKSEATREFYDQVIAALTKSIESGRESMNKQYDDAQKEAYINHQRQQFALPGQLAASGLTGGASETANINLNNNYSNNMTNINRDRVTANNELDKNIVDIQNQYNMTAGEKILADSQSAIDAYLSLSGNAVNYDYQTQRDAIEDERYKEEMAYQREQDALANKRYEDEIAYQKERDALEDKRYEDNLIYERAKDSISNGKNALNRAIELAQMGDSSELLSLGYTDLAAAISDEREFDNALRELELKNREAEYKTSMGELSLVDGYLGGDNAYGRFETENALNHNAKMLIDNGIIKKAEYNRWAATMGYPML